MSEHLIFLFESSDGLAVGVIPAAAATLIACEDGIAVVSQSRPMIVPPGESIESVHTSDLVNAFQDKVDDAKQRGRLAQRLQGVLLPARHPSLRRPS